MTFLVSKNSNSDLIIHFNDVDMTSLKCRTEEYSKQCALLLACLEKYKQIILTSKLKSIVETHKINNHYLKSSEKIIIQKSYLKFLKDILQDNPTPHLTFEHVFNLLV